MEISLRRVVDGRGDTLEWATVSAGDLAAAIPWRTFRWYRGQKHYSGWYWSSSTGDLVIYESRLELSNLIPADFDRTVHRIIAQPFLFRAIVDGTERRHVPDYFFDTGNGPVIVDVKPASQLQNEAVAEVLAWTRRVVEAKGWCYRVATEPHPVRMSNVRFLAGYRNPAYVGERVMEQVRSAVVSGSTIGGLVRAVPGEPATVRAAVLRMLWHHYLETDLDTALTAEHRITREPWPAVPHA